MSKIAIVTGGSRGLGKNMAMSLAQNGNHVILTYLSREQEAADVVAAIAETGQKAAAVQLDVSDSKRFGEFTSQLKNILKDQFETEKFDYLINNAGIGIHTPYLETTEDQFDSLVNIHLKSAFFLTQKLVPLMNDEGGIVNVSTGLARFCLPGYEAYAMMKGGVETLTKYQAKALGDRGINVNVIAPGAIETDFGGGAVRDNAEVNQFIASQTALGRAGKPDDIGGVVAFLCSSQAKWINAQRIEISGGMFL